MAITVNVTACAGRVRGRPRRPRRAAYDGAIVTGETRATLDVATVNVALVTPAATATHPRTAATPVLLLYGSEQANEGLLILLSWPCYCPFPSPSDGPGRARELSRSIRSHCARVRGEKPMARSETSPRILCRCCGDLPREPTGGV